jgi:copper homeostasis protein
MIQIEICAPGRVSAENAKAGGASRIELCENLNIGGTTPSMDDVEYSVHELRLRTHVLIRPRGGDFCYDEGEYRQIINYIGRCKEAGAQCVVVGFLTADGEVDIERTKAAVEAAEGMEVTFHRAFDRVEDPYKALEEVIGCGCHRILTSGCKPTAEEGIGVLKELVRRADGRIKILAGSGVTPENAARIVRETGVREIHGSCKRFDCKGVAITDSEKVRQLISNLKDYE